MNSVMMVTVKKKKDQCRSTDPVEGSREECSNKGNLSVNSNSQSSKEKEK